MSAPDDEDPFDAFGSDSEEDDDGGASNETLGSVSQLLVQAANQKLGRNSSNENVDNVAKEVSGESIQQKQKQPTVDLSYLKRLELPSWPPPLYQGPILLVEELPVGGGRGYVAAQNIPSGTLVMLEEPMMPWPEEQLGHKLNLVSVRHLLEHAEAATLVPQFEEFHPTKNDMDHVMNVGSSNGEFDEATTEQIVKMTKLVRSELNAEEKDVSTEEDPDFEASTSDEIPEAVKDLVLLAEQRNICSTDGSALSSTDILRLLLALRYNGLESGVYRHVAMLNHNDYPNCTKFLPDNTQSFSEVRTTRPVQAGETLTISYLPRILSHSSRRRHLWEQHRFDIGTSHLKGMLYKMELVGTNQALPASPLEGGNGESTTERIEKATEELETMQSEITAEIESLGNFETAKALELSSLELFHRSVEELHNEGHILMIPILTLHVDACALVLKDPALAKAVRLGVLSRQTLSSHRLLRLQQELLGPDHFDLARTNLDLANSISELLSRSAKHLYELQVPNMSTFSSWSSLESKARKEHYRIKQVYPHDAAQIIANAKS